MLSSRNLAIFISFLFFFLTSVFAFASYVPIGKGCTNAYYIDKDCDGYGVASPNGPDADDNDPEVNTPETVIAKYGTLENFLHHLGYNPERIFFIATDGNDDTGEVNNIDKPYKTWSKVKQLHQPGDAVIYREGSYHETIGFVYPPFQGVAGKPLIVMAYPGEKAVIDVRSSSISIGDSSYITFDGFILDNTQDSWGNGIRMYNSNHMVFRNIEAMHHSIGFDAMQDLHNILTENCVIHNNSHSHGIYWGSRDYPNSDMIIRNCLVYKNGWHGFQHNGRVTNLVLENNIIHSNGFAGISLLEGVSDSVFRSNLIFNNNRSGVIFFLYDSTSPYILPYNQTNNLFVNNLFWIGKYNGYGDGQEPNDFAAILFNDSTAAQNRSMDGNVFRNNIFVTHNGATFNFYQKRFAASTTIENNVIYRVNGSGDVMSYGGDAYNFESFQNFSNLIKNNTFQDPRFTDVSMNYNLNPEKFNFDYLPDSPAIDFGINTDAPLTDLRGNSRIGGIDAGCYEYAPTGLAILTQSLSDGTVNTAYNVTLSASGGMTPYAWSIASGSLPAGLTLNSSNGMISGTPTTEGTSTFTAKVTDSSNPAKEVTKEFSVTINEQTQLLTVTTGSLAGATVGTEYTATLSASGGTEPYSWSIASGSLPAGLTLNSNGVISGTPTTAGTSTFTAKVSDSSNPAEEVTKDFTLTVNEQTQPLAITIQSLSDGTVNAAYSVTLSASGGTEPYSWSIASGSLPAGLTLNSNGVISETPTTAGTITFTVKVTDASQNSTKQLSIKVDPAIEPLAITTGSLPDGTTGESYSATLSANGGTAPYTWSITSLPPGLNSNKTGEISGEPTEVGTYTVMCTVTDSSSPVQTTSKSLALTIIEESSGLTTISLRDEIADTTLDGYSETRKEMNLGGVNSLEIWSNGVRKILLKADLSQIPEGATINKAELKLYCYSLRWPHNPELDLYRVTHAWEEGTGRYYQTPNSGATWYQYDVGSGDWYTPGGDVDTTVDFGYGPNGLVSEAVMQEDSWVTFDITGLAQKWVCGDMENNGVLIQAIQKSYNGARFYSSEYADESLMPVLTVSYSIASANTPSISTSKLPAGKQYTDYEASIAATGGTLPYQWSIQGLPTGLYWESADDTTITVYGIPSETGQFHVQVTVEDEYGQRGVKDLTLAVTEAQTVTVTLRDETSDTTLDSYTEARKEMNLGGVDALYIWSNGVRKILLKADLSQIPEGATINKAELKLYCYSLSWPYNPKLDLYGVTHTWEEGTSRYYRPPDGATWYQYDVSAGDWYTQGGDVDTTTDFGNGPNGLVSEAVMQEDSWVIFDITGLAQKWVCGDMENNGVLIQATKRGCNAARFYSSEYADESLRPELVIGYSC